MSDSIRDETPHFSLSHRDARISSGATFVAFLNLVHKDVSRQRRFYGSGMDIASILSSLAGGGVGGAVVMAIVGLIKPKMAKP
jgi:hypothetical protein